MRAVVLPGINQPLDVRDDHPLPTHEGGELIDVTACGVCHSDLHVVDGDFPSPLPLVLGHEVTGVHHELGPVMVYAPWGCGHCVQCADGLEMICTDSTEAGLFTDGGYAEQMWVPHRRYLASLGGLDPIAAAPLACGGLTAFRAVSHTLDALRHRGRDGRAVVIGAGGLGQMAIAFLRLQTEASVTAIDLDPSKQARAIELGASVAVGGDIDVDPADVVIDFIGAPATLERAAKSVAKQGDVIVVGLAGGRIPFGFAAVPHEARFRTSVWGSRAQLDELLELARREPSAMPSVETLPLARAQMAHDRLRSGDVAGRLVLVP